MNRINCPYLNKGSAFFSRSIDSPPQRSQICKSVTGAADQIIIPCEATVKGYGSLVRTLDAVIVLLIATLI